MKNTKLFIFLLWFLCLPFVYSQQTESSVSPLSKEELDRIVKPSEQLLPTTNYQPKGVVRWSEGFEGTTFPPVGWTMFNLDAGTQTWARFTTRPIFGTASAAVRWETATLANDDWLITHRFVVDSGAILNFFATRQGTTFLDSVEVLFSSTASTPPVGFTKLATIMPAGITPEQFRIPLGALAGQNISIAFRYKELDEFRFYLDSVYVEVPVAVDAGVHSILFPTGEVPAVGGTPRVLIRNFGINATPTFNARLIISPGGYSQTAVVRAIPNTFGIDTVVFPNWVPPGPGTYSVTVITELSGDLNRTNDTMRTTATVLRELPIQFNIDASAVYPLGASWYGAEFDGTRFYITRWNLNRLWRLNRAGTTMDSVDITGIGVAGIRDLAWDGQFLYGSTNTTSVFRIDPSTGAATLAFTSPIAVRGIAYNAAQDAFWVSNWGTEIRLVSRAGATLVTIPAATHLLTGMAGMAYDTLSPGGPFIWVFDGGTDVAPKVMHQLTATGTRVESFVVTPLFPAGSIAGGMFVTSQYLPGTVTVGILNQGTPHRLVGFKTGDVSVTPMGRFTILSPNGGETFAQNSNQVIAWRDTAITGNVTIRLSADGGLTFPTVIASDIPNRGVFAWRTGTTTGANFRVRVESVANPLALDNSNANFSITGVQTINQDNPFVISDGVNTTLLRYGIDTSATDGINPLLGEAELPPPPPAGVFDGRFIGSDIGIPALGQGVARDYRFGGATFAGTRVHAIQYQLATTGDSLRLFWNLPTGVTGQIQDFVTGTVVNVAMSGAGRFVVPNPGIINKLRITLTYSPAVTLGAFGLSSPANNARIVVRDNDTTLLHFRWGRSLNANTYRFRYGHPTISTVILNRASNNTGADTVFSIRASELFTSLVTAGVVDSVAGQWAAWSYRTGSPDSLRSTSVFGVNFVLQRTVQPFNLVFPANNARIIARQFDTTMLHFRWNRALNANTYRFRYGHPTLPPTILDRLANSSGVDTVFSIRGNDLYNALTAVGALDSVNGQWAAWAYRPGVDSVRSTTVFNVRIILTRGSSVGTELVPNSFELSQNYPNPFNPVTNIKYEIPKSSDVKIEIFNIQGEVVATLVNQHHQAGFYQVAFDASSLHSGVYFYRITAGEFVNVKKMVLMK